MRFTMIPSLLIITVFFMAGCDQTPPYQPDTPKIKVEPKKADPKQDDSNGDILAPYKYDPTKDLDVCRAREQRSRELELFDRLRSISFKIKMKNLVKVIKEFLRVNESLKNCLDPGPKLAQLKWLWRRCRHDFICIVRNRKLQDWDHNLNISKYLALFTDALKEGAPPKVIEYRQKELAALLPHLKIDP